MTGESAYTASWGYNPLGNMTRAIKDGATTWYSYDDPAHAHAVTQAGVPLYGYDANGNMVSRGADTLTYDPENRLTQVVVGGVTTSYAYAGDGRRVKKTVTTGGATTTTYYVGNYYEVEVAPGPVTTTTSYYYFGSLRVAMKRGSEPPIYLYGDHLGSMTVWTTDNGTQEDPPQTYYPYGSVRSGSLPTDYAFTGQRQDSNGLMFYQARYYDAALGRFVQPDSIIPDPYNPQSLNRYSYGLNNPVKYRDPTGHCVQVEDEPDGLCIRWEQDDNDEDDDEKMVIVHGGSQFANRTEVGFANYLLTGREGWLGAVSDGNPAFLTESLHAVASHLGFETSANGQVPPDVLASLAAAAVVSRGDKSDNNAIGALRPGMNGNADHVQGVTEAREYYMEIYRGSDVVFEFNKSIKDTLRIDRRPDITIRDAVTREILRVVEVARVTAQGDWVPRELAKMEQYRNAGLDFTFWKVP